MGLSLGNLLRAKIFLRRYDSNLGLLGVLKSCCVWNQLKFSFSSLGVKTGFLIPLLLVSCVRSIKRGMSYSHRRSRLSVGVSFV